MNFIHSNVDIISIGFYIVIAGLLAGIMFGLFKFKTRTVIDPRVGDAINEIKKLAEKAGQEQPEQAVDFEPLLTKIEKLQIPEIAVPPRSVLNGTCPIIEGRCREDDCLAFHNYYCTALRRYLKRES